MEKPLEETIVKVGDNGIEKLKLPIIYPYFFKNEYI